MGVLAQYGKPMWSSVVTLTNAAPSVVAVTPVAGAWTDVYAVQISANDTNTNTVTITDGATTLTYLVGGNAGGANPPVFDQGTIPVRFRTGTAITVASTGVTSGKNVQVSLRGLFSKS